jgi:hypothetical protein
MSILWPFRQQCSHLILRHLTSNTIQPVSIVNLHTRARKSPYAGTKDVHVRFFKIKI